MTGSGDTPLGDRLKARIDADGPIGVDDFMAACLGNAQDGYYQQSDPFGSQGDFTTAPEISGLFGEMCGLYLAHMFELAGAPSQTSVIELGPGRGTLMRDMRHVWAQLMPKMTECPVHLLETSQHLRQLQADLLGDADTSWYGEIDTLLAASGGPLFGIANEFFDALPVTQLIRHHGNWHHRQVAVHDGRLTFAIGPVANDLPIPFDEQAASHDDMSDGTVIEHCPLADSVMSALASAIARRGGAILIVDYGSNGNPGDSLQAVAAHKPVDIFHMPGAADLSHWVDFAALGRAASAAGARLIPPVSQGRFLLQVGLAERAEAAGKLADPETRRALYAAVDRLTSPAQMGTVFKMALLVPDGDGLPPGFAHDDLQEDPTSKGQEGQER